VTKRPGLSIVVEWDNVRVAGASRARQMLERLRREILDLDGWSVEVLLVHDGRPGDAAVAERLLADAGAEIRVVSAPGCGYYELKNAGARDARGDVVLFVDCDVYPEEGWLSEMLRPFADSDVSVVAAATYMETDGLWGKSMAMASVFPPREGPGPVQRTERFFANSLALRRETAAAFPFPQVAGAARASCVVLARRFVEANVVVVVNPAARVGHPPPAGIGPALIRAFVHGRDSVLLADAGVGPPATPEAVMRRIGRMAATVLRDRRKVGLTPTETPIATVMTLAYHGVAAAGGLFARLAPDRAARLQL
jgi:hypothetical protein